MTNIIIRSEYHTSNLIIHELIASLPKYKRRAKLWLDLFEKPRSNQLFPDDVQRTVQIYFLHCIRGNITVGPFKINPKRFSDPLHYAATNYTLADIRCLLLQASISLLKKKDLTNDDCIGVIQHISHFGFHCTRMSYKLYQENLNKNKLGAGAIQAVLSSYPQ